MAAEAEIVTGLILAGGRASRFGADKGAALLAGKPLIAHVRERLALHCRAVAVNAPAGGESARVAAALGLEVVGDEAGTPAGPLAGVLAGLHWTRELGGGLMISLPCDTPLVPPDLVARLAAAAQGRFAAVARTPDGAQSLCAAWRTTSIAHLEMALAQGEHPSVQALLTQLACGVADFAESQAFRNINTRADLAAAERDLGR